MWRFLSGVVLAFGVVGTALPYSWATVEPGPNAYGWNNTPVLVRIEASGSTGLVVRYILDGTGPFSQSPPVVIPISSEGVHTLRYWAEDASGPESPNVLTIRIDLTPPTIMVCVPEEGKKYFLNERVPVVWFAYDRLSGVEFVDTPAGPKGFLDTTSPGYQTFWVLARDRAGNISRLEVDYQVICKLVPLFPTGFWLDRLLPPEEQVKVGMLPVLARYRVGEEIKFAFILRDVNDLPFVRGRPNVLVTEVRFTDEGERHTIWDWRGIPYDEEQGRYFLRYSTSERRPGLYDLWLGFGDGQSVRIRIELGPPE